MPKRTYEVNITASALRTIKVRAGSGQEALEVAESRIKRVCGPWTIDFPGGDDEHYSVNLMPGDEWVGPDAQGGFKDGEEAD